MDFRKLEFENADGRKLGARLDLPEDGDPEVYALFAHCFTCTKNLKAVGHISRGLTQEGVAVLRFDFTGLGESEGDFAETNLSSNVDDLLSAAALLEESYEAPKILVGHSMGGAAVLQAASRIPSSVAVATIATPAEPGHFLRFLGEARQTIEREGEAEVTLGGRSFRIRRQFVEDLEATRMEAAIRGLGRALLVFHSPADRIVEIEHAARIFRAARHPKSFVSLDGADHLLSDPADSLYVGSLIGAWAGRYLGRFRPSPGPDPSAS